MITAGCDVGSLTAKAVIMEQGNILGSSIQKVRAHPEQAGKQVMETALQQAGLDMDDVQVVFGTGYGGKNLPFVHHFESEITCHCQGAIWQEPETGIIIDIGGQDVKAIKTDAQGNVIRYIYNDKCASGTGRFLEIIAQALELELDELGEIHGKSTKDLSLSNQCVVFAETEVISLVGEGEEIPDIVRAMHYSVAHRAASLARSLEMKPVAVMTGGVAKNQGMFSALQDSLGTELRHVPYFQLNGAIGAALLAEGRGQITDDREQMTEDRKNKPEVGEQCVCIK
ncbi:MAG: acyl-CoA dehydratase activase [Thermodesulfobacteriota bacterium]